MFHTYIKASSGNDVDIDRASFVMDMDLFDIALNEISAQRVWDKYCALHEAKYGSKFTPDVDVNWDVR